MNKEKLAGKTAVYYTRVGACDENAVESFEPLYRQAEKAFQGTTILRFYIDRGDDNTQFNELLADAEKGEFDFVICRSISRFVRRYQDLTVAIKLLQDAGKSLYVQMEDEIVDEKNNYILMLLTEFAKEESKAKSESAKRGWETRRRNNILDTPTSEFLGHKKSGAI